MSAYAANSHYAVKPSDGVTQSQPFTKGLADSNSYRIPAMITIDEGEHKGRIVAAADVRWNTTYDGGGLDTMVSYSDDNGINWNYSLVNYMGDNGNTYNGSDSTTFIDPSLVYDGNKVWMLCDLLPYGIALNGKDNTHPTKETGFDDNGHLLLSNNNYSSYDYYLNFEDSKIYKKDDNTPMSNYTVDKKFNLTKVGDDSVNTNLFFKDSPFKVQRTGYLYLISSEDGGKTFSDPMLLPLKKDDERVCLVGPGRGLCTKNGTIVFPCYSHTSISPGVGVEEKTCFIYSTDGGSTWKRSNSATTTTKSSESALVELPNGNLRFFYRHQNDVFLRYIDAELSGDTYIWKQEVKTDIKINTATQMSAMIYSEPINGKPAFLLSCPTGKDGQGSTSPSGDSGKDRVNGKILVGLLNDDTNNTIVWLEPYNAADENTPFMYSCLTELKKEGNNKKAGDIALLYEDKQNGWGANNNTYFTIKYTTHSIADIVKNNHIGSSALDEQLRKAETLVTREDTYTTSSHQRLKDAVTKAKKGKADNEERAELDKYAAEISTAINGLKERAKTDEAKTIFEKATKEIEKKDKYTTESLKILSDATTSLKTVIDDNSDVDEYSMKELISKVNDAISKLVFKNKSEDNKNSNNSSGYYYGYSSHYDYSNHYNPIAPVPSSENKTDKAADKKEENITEPSTSKKLKENDENSKLTDKTPTDTEISKNKKDNTAKKIFTLPSKNNLITLKSVSVLDKIATRKIELKQNKTNINVSITSEALSKLVARKSVSFIIKGKHFNVRLNAKNIQTLNKLTHKKFTIKVNKQKNGKFKIKISIDGKILSTKKIANLKIKVK
ncbi:MAG: exo-alpha-sialidase [Peptoanaerobacter stomatis]|uniref:exo-alpha-sialidase n=1 Tax=Peptoanaerobacter stomatis TaxID=796937 RepID=UPI003F9F87EC